MAIVSISKAAKLVRKSRTTVQKYIKDGKLSKCAGENGAEGIDTSELLRVFGEFSGHIKTMPNTAQNVRDFTLDHADEKTIKIIELEAKLDKANAIIDEKEKTIKAQEKHIGSLDKAMHLIEDQRQKKQPEMQAEPKKEAPKGFFKRLFN